MFCIRILFLFWRSCWWVFTFHMLFYQKYIGGVWSLNSYQIFVVLESNIKNSSGSVLNFSNTRCQRVFQISATTFADTSLECYCYQLSQLFNQHISILIRPRATSSHKNKRSQAENGRCFLEPYDDGQVWCGFQVTQWNQSDTFLNLIFRLHTSCTLCYMTSLW